MIKIDNLSVSSTAPAGTVVGTLSLMDASNTMRAANFMCTKDAAGFFAIAGGKLVTVKTPTPTGTYPVKVKAVGTAVWLDGVANFVVTVTN